MTAFAALKYQTAATLTMGATIGNNIYKAERKLYYSILKQQSFPNIHAIDQPFVKLIFKLLNLEKSSSPSTNKKKSDKLSKITSNVQDTHKVQINTKNAREEHKKRTDKHEMSPEELAKVEAMIHSNLEWINSFAQSSANVLGIILAFQFRKASFIVSACTSGSEMLLDAVEEVSAMMQSLLL
jgi:hypothetical protein